MPRTKAKTKAACKSCANSNNKKKVLKRRKASSAGAANQYALPTAYQTAEIGTQTSTQQNLVENAQESLDKRKDLERSQQTYNRQQRQEDEDRNIAREEGRTQDLATTGKKAATYAAKTSANLIKEGTTWGAKRAAEKVANEALKKGAMEAGKKGIGAAAGASSSAVMPIALAAQLAGTGIEKLTGDEDDTTYNAGEISGGLLKGAGTGAAWGATAGSVIPGIGNVVGGVAGAVVGAGVEGYKMIRDKKKAEGEETKRRKRRDERREEYGRPQDEAFRDAFTVQGRDMGYNIGQSTGNSYLGGYQMAQGGGRRKYQTTGELLPPTRVEGSTTMNTSSIGRNNKEKFTSNFNSSGVHTNLDSGARAEYTISDVNKPNIFGKQKTRYTDDYTWYNPQGDITSHSETSINNRGLRRERGYNINPETGRKDRFGTGLFRESGGRKVPGGEVIQLPGGATEFRGNKHGQSGKGSDSGIVLEESTKAQAGIEVENGETMDAIKFADGGENDYIFSSYLKLGGKSFAQRHKDILKKGGNQAQLQQLAKMQEEKAKQVGKTPTGPTNEYGERGKEYIARYGGVKPRKQAQLGALLTTVAPYFPVTAGAVLAKKGYDAYQDWQNEPVDTGDVSPEGQVTTQLGDTTTQNTETPAPYSTRQTVENQAAQASTPTTGDTTTNTPTAPRAPRAPQGNQDYKDEWYTREGTQISLEDFEHKGSGPHNIDYQGNINTDDWEGALETLWADNIVGDRTVTSQKELQDIYKDEYVPMVNDYFDNSPDQAYSAIVNFANSGHPNAINLQKKIGTLKDGKWVLSASKEEVLALGRKYATDGKIGTFHSLFTGSERGEDMTPIEPKTDDPQVDAESSWIKSLQVPGKVIPKTELDRLKPPRTRDIPPLAYLGAAAQALGPAMALASKYKQPERISPGMQGPERLGRVNYNAERAANANNSTATNRFIENTGSGPAGIAAMMASNEGARQGSIKIANEESRQNMQLANAEKQLNANITSKNIGNKLQADKYNSAMKYDRDTKEYEKRTAAFNALGNIGGQTAKDILEYKATAREAKASQIAGEYTRQEYTETLMRKPKYRKMLKNAGIDPNDVNSVRRIAAQMWDPTKTQEELDQMVKDYLTANPDEKKQSGGYFKQKYGGINRKNLK
jgi:hypothetical protein